MTARGSDSEPARRRNRRSAGFTLIEMVMVIILVGVMAFVLLPRLNDTTFDERGLHDAVKAAVSHARHVAVGARRYVCVNLTPGGGGTGKIALLIDPALPETGAALACATPVALPAPGPGCGASNEVCAPNGVTLAGSSLVFDPLGRSVNAAKAVTAKVTLGVSNQPDITVEGETGFVQ